MRRLANDEIPCNRLRQRLAARLDSSPCRSYGLAHPCLNTVHGAEPRKFMNKLFGYGRHREFPFTSRVAVSVAVSSQVRKKISLRQRPEYFWDMFAVAARTAFALKEIRHDRRRNADAE